jgi:uncharacterized spore protein YtfJ
MSEQSFVERLAQTIQQHASARQVYGEPVVHDDVTIIPVARVQWGVGGGGIEHAGIERGGGGGGVRSTPVGFIEVRDETSTFRPIVTAGDGAVLAGVAIAGVLGGLLVGKLSRR